MCESVVQPETTDESIIQRIGDIRILHNYGYTHTHTHTHSM
jgi:hypothetical protein